MEATGCATAGAICTCAPAQNRRERPQVLPAYGLQDLRKEPRNPKTNTDPNTTCLPITLGENNGSGHFYMAKTRTFLLCVDREKSRMFALLFALIGLLDILVHGSPTSMFRSSWIILGGG